MNVTLPPQAEAMVRERVESGRYPDESAVVLDALELLEERDRLERLRSALQVGLDQLERGEGREYTPELRAEIWANVQRKAKEGHTPKPDILP